MKNGYTQAFYFTISEKDANFICFYSQVQFMAITIS